ncbi:hypothetical protein EJ04DRAFT_518500 [Polyplosphaeria fusca]|uniref:Uncharacterized protein n=1 Tax=Polyplosphaeria fusca TaxID=682080 RepID=A0A9P4R7L0_9PLEO|nr:hypothetical protein EJ04DRAFT_518500 [Polyplosphaeria fusca]
MHGNELRSAHFALCASWFAASLTALGPGCERGRRRCQQLYVTVVGLSHLQFYLPTALHTFTSVIASTASRLFANQSHSVSLWSLAYASAPNAAPERRAGRCGSGTRCTGTGMRHGLIQSSQSVVRWGNVSQLRARSTLSATPTYRQQQLHARVGRCPRRRRRSGRPNAGPSASFCQTVNCLRRVLKVRGNGLVFVKWAAAIRSRECP